MRIGYLRGAFSATRFVTSMRRCTRAWANGTSEVREVVAMRAHAELSDQGGEDLHRDTMFFPLACVD